MTDHSEKHWPLYRNGLYKAMIKICLYQDYVHNNSILRQRLQDVFGAGAVQDCDADDILAGALNAGIDLFVMPGGADLFYREKLDGAGNAAIKSYVEEGGAYLGICAGAYYACAALDWWPEQEREGINGPRALAFHKGKAAGPIREYICDGDYDRSWDGVANLSWQGQQIKTLYRAGPLFETGRGEQVLAAYDDLAATPPAIIHCKVGRGQAVLCSPHIELNAADYQKVLYQHRNPDYAYCAALISALAPDDALRDALWRDLLKNMVQ